MSIRIIEVAADFVADTKRALLIPVLFFFIAIAWTFAWLYGYICVTSVGVITPSSYQLQTKSIDYGAGTANMLWIMIFGYFWIIAFILSCNEFVIVCAAASWYFSDKTIEDSDGIPGDADVWKGFFWIPRYHFGSIALGSLLIAVVWMIRFIFEYVAKKVQDASGNNAFTRGLLCCIRCCLDCFDRFMRYLTRNAYIYMAISSESFCSSALNAFILMLKNAAKFAFVEGFSEVFMFIAKLSISLFSTLASLIIMKYALASNPVSSPIIPGIIILLLSFVVAGIFVSIFDAAANTILQCYLLDQDVAKHHALDAKHVPKALERFLGVLHKEESD